MKILFLALSALLFLGCSQEKKQESHKATEVKAEVQTPVKNTAVKETAVKEVPQTVETNKTAVVKEVAVTTKQEQTPIVEKKVVEVKKVKTEVVPKEVAVVQKATVNGVVVFKKCIGCHGANAEKKALNKSQVIKGWDAQKVLTALHGYKDGTYGGTMKSVMKSQISNLSDDELKAVAEHISKL
jgi:cytochrome c553